MMHHAPLPFDELLKLASNDPEGLERYRQQQIQAIIEQAPDYLRQRLEGLQFQIDSHRQISKNPLGTCIKISQMMHDSFEHLQQLLTNFDEYRTLFATETAEEEHSRLPSDLPSDESVSAKILPFPSATNRNCAVKA